MCEDPDQVMQGSELMIGNSQTFHALNFPGKKLDPGSAALPPPPPPPPPPQIPSLKQGNIPATAGRRGRTDTAERIVLQHLQPYITSGRRRVSGRQLRRLVSGSEIRALARSVMATCVCRVPPRHPGAKPSFTILSCVSIPSPFPAVAAFFTEYSPMKERWS